jgi:hypothetical protein
LQTADAPECLEALERLLGTVRLQYLLLFLAFVRAAHYWTRVHPEIQFEDDIKELLATHEALAKGCCRTANFEFARNFAGKFSTLGG